jgi:hypothetical protein
MAVRFRFIDDFYCLMGGRQQYRCDGTRRDGDGSKRARISEVEIAPQGRFVGMIVSERKHSSEGHFVVKQRIVS